MLCYMCTYSYDDGLILGVDTILLSYHEVEVTYLCLLCIFSSRLDPILYRKCQNDASRLCHTPGWNESSELMPPGAVFSCLYRHAYRTEEQGRRVRSTNNVHLSY